MSMQIVSEVKSLDVGYGATATELVGFLHTEQTSNGFGRPYFTFEKILPFNVSIIWEPWPWQDSNA